MLIGPKDTPYFGGNYFFEFKYPTDYPHTPPKVRYCTNGNEVRFNPNLYKCGKVCISLLNTWRGDQWTSCQTISSVLLTLCTLLCKNPLLNEPGVNLNHPDIESYNRIIEFANLDIAIYCLLTKRNGIYQPFFDPFYSFMRENFIKNYEEIIQFCEKKCLEPVNHSTQISTFYSMKMIINYNWLIIRFKECKTLLNF